MRGARIAALLVAATAVGCYLTMVVGGGALGWEATVAGPPGEPPAQYDVWGELPWMTTLLGATLVGAFLAAKRPRHPIPWLVAAAGLGFLGYPTVVVTVALGVGRGHVPGWAPYVAWIGNWTWVVGHVGTIYLLLLFPNGRTLGGWWRRLARAGGGYVAVAMVILAGWPELEAAPQLANPFGVAALGRAEGALVAFILGFVVLQLLAVASLVVRFVGSRGVERQQMKWMAFGSTAVGLTIPATLLGAPRWIQAFAAALLVAAVVVAVTRYRLYDIDRLVSRTLAYALLTLVLVGVYAAVVTSLGGLARASADRGGGDLAVAVSTLVVAALFRPVRRRAQSVVDRHFNRARYDAERTIAAFAQRLRAQVDREALVDDLEATATVALQPGLVSVWLVGSTGSREAT